jgi:predicted naringenin-chalcone synthase
MHLTQLSTAVPKYKYSTKEMIELFPEELPNDVKQNVLNLGVSERYLAYPPDSLFESKLPCADEDPVAEVCIAACKQALRSSDVSPKNVDFLIATYDSNSFLCPGLSSYLLHELDLKPDIKHVSVQGMACSAFVRVIQLAEDHLARNSESVVIISLSGVNSSWFSNQIRGLKDVKAIRDIKAMQNDELKLQELRKWVAVVEFFLFGDGAACIIASNKKQGPEIAHVASITNLRKADYFVGYAKLMPSLLPFMFEFQSGLSKNIPELGLEYTSTVLKKLFSQQKHVSANRAKKWMVHTGSRRILDSIAKSYVVAYEKIRESYEVLERYGNLAGASLPFILGMTLRKSELEKGDYAVMLNYGWGFSANASLINF